MFLFTYFHFSPLVRLLLFIMVALVAITSASIGGYLAYQYAKHDGNQRDLGAVVTNGLECSKIGRYVLVLCLVYRLLFVYDDKRLVQCFSFENNNHFIILSVSIGREYKNSARMCLWL